MCGGYRQTNGNNNLMELAKGKTSWIFIASNCQRIQRKQIISKLIIFHIFRIEMAHCRIGLFDSNCRLPTALSTPPLLSYRNVTGHLPTISKRSHIHRAARNWHLCVPNDNSARLYLASTSRKNLRIYFSSIFPQFESPIVNSFADIFLHLFSDRGIHEIGICDCQLYCTRT